MQIYRKIAFLILAVQCVASIYSVHAQSSSNYQLEGYEFGGGGGTVGSTNYGINATLGEQVGALSSTNYKANSGLSFLENTDVPPAPTFVNDSGNRYNRLKITIAQGGNPTDAKYAIAISDDNWVSTKYVQSDATVGVTLGIEDYQTYASWGGASGSFIIGLTASTTYKVKVKALQGAYSESAYGPEASAATLGLQVVFDLDVGGTSDPGETGAPYTIAMGNLTQGTVVTATNRVWLDFATNGESGGFVYLYDQYGGLRSTTTSYTITSSSTNLTSASEGFGLQGASKTQTSGGPLEYVSPYDVASENVGIVDTTIRKVFSTTNSPIVGGRGSLSIKAKASSTTPASTDYADTLLMIASAGF